MPEQGATPQAPTNELRAIIVSAIVGELRMIASQWERENRFAHCGYYVADLRTEADALERGDIGFGDVSH